MSLRPQTMTAMVLAAGFGKRLRPLTLETPKPLVRVAGRTLLDRTLDLLETADVTRAIVNIHYLGDQIERHCAHRVIPRCTISDERDAILETGGGIVRALPLLGTAPFFSLNADTFWVEKGASNLAAMAQRFDPDRMDMMLMIARPDDATGHSGGLDFVLDDQGRLTRHGDRVDAHAPSGTAGIYAGAAIINPALFDGASTDPHSLNRYFDRSIETGRLFGWQMRDSHWYTVGTVDDLHRVEAALGGLAGEAQS